jgi:putative Mn2+ efflux pump MntP
MKSILKIALAIGLLIWQSYVLTVLWRWFITFEWQILPPSLIIMMGLMLIKGVFVTKPEEVRQSQETDDMDYATDVVNAYLLPLVALGIGWIFTLFR